MPSLKSNVLEVSINSKIVARLGLRRSGNGYVIFGVHSLRKREAITDPPQYVTVGSLEVDRKGTYRFFDFLDHVALNVGDIVSIRVKKGGTLSSRHLRRKETKRQRELSRIKYSKTAKP